MYQQDERIVMTLDAGGTNFVFSAVQANKEMIEPLRYSSHADVLEDCLNILLEGFRAVLALLPTAPVAISFAFPGPADYPKGIIGDLPNFPAFRGGIALGPFLEHHFQLPVFINNDGDLFAYGEAMAGALPRINQRLKQGGSPRQYKNLIGLTLGTGFGAGVVIGGQLLIGDNSDGGNVWNNRNKKYPHCIVEESVSIRAVQRVYAMKSGEDAPLSPKEIFEIAEGELQGDKLAAIAAFEELGEMAGDICAHAVNLIDGLVVIGGGLVGAEKYIIPAMVAEMNRTTQMISGDSFPRMSIKIIDLERDFDALFAEKRMSIKIPMTELELECGMQKITGICASGMGTSEAIALGAYAFALQSIDQAK